MNYFDVAKAITRGRPMYYQSLLRFLANPVSKPVSTIHIRRLPEDRWEPVCVVLESEVPSMMRAFREEGWLVAAVREATAWR